MCLHKCPEASIVILPSTDETFCVEDEEGGDFSNTCCFPAPGSISMPAFWDSSPLCLPNAWWINGGNTCKQVWTPCSPQRLQIYTWIHTWLFKCINIFSMGSYNWLVNGFVRKFTRGSRYARWVNVWVLCLPCMCLSLTRSWIMWLACKIISLIG